MMRKQRWRLDQKVRHDYVTPPSSNVNDTNGKTKIERLDHFLLSSFDTNNDI